MRRPRGDDKRVLPLELFFDLVCVLAITQCTALMAHEPTWAAIGKGLLVLGILWWTWIGYAWLTSVVDPEEGIVRLLITAAMAARAAVRPRHQHRPERQEDARSRARSPARRARDGPLGGTALYLLAHVAIRWRNVHRLTVSRLGVSAFCVAMIALAVHIPAVATLSVLAAVLISLIVYERRRFAELRQRLRRQLAQ